MTSAPPIRFLALALGGWICIRAVILIPGWWTGAGTAEAVPRSTARTDRGGPGAPRWPAATLARATVPLGRHRGLRSPLSGIPDKGIAPDSAHSWRGRASWSLPMPGPATAPLSAPGQGALTLGPEAASAPLQRRWSASAWLLLRDERGRAALVPGGTLGGSQTGARLRYEMGGGWALSGRVYLPLRRRRGAEAAVGLEWRPSPRIPLRLLAERRQDLGGEGRSAFALSVHGGLGRDLPRGLRIDAYGQAGVVGTDARDPFADGSVRLSAPVGPLELGAGAWGGAQPGARRLDAGPSVSYRLPVSGAALRVQVDWRFRVAGDAAPGSGPALTLGADF